MLASEGRERREAGRLPSATVAVAEYTAVVQALRCALEAGVARLEVRTDARLVVEQLEGRAPVRQPAVVGLRRRVDELAGALGTVRYRWVRRAENGAADALVEALLSASDAGT